MVWTAMLTLGGGTGALWEKPHAELKTGPQESNIKKTIAHIKVPPTFCGFIKL